MPSQKPINLLEDNLSAVKGIGLIADKWSLMIIYVLKKKGVMRYTDLQMNIGKISSKILTQTLRKLERDGLVSRKIYPVIPPKVEYSLTHLGDSLVPVIETFCRWTTDNHHAIEVAQTRYDEQSYEAKMGRMVLAD